MKAIRKLLIVLACMTTVLAMAGCGAGDVIPTQSPEDAATEVVTTMLDALKAGDVDALESIGATSVVSESDEVAGEDDRALETAVLKAAFGHMEYEIVEAEAGEDDIVNVKCKITNVDMSKAATYWFEDVMVYAMSQFDPEASDKDTEEMETKLMDMLVKAVDQTAEEEDGIQTSEVTIKVQKNEDGDYQVIDPDKTLFDDLSGGFAEKVANMFGGAVQDEKKDGDR